MPGKCLFDSEDKLNFMVFWGEGFRGGKSDTLKFYFSIIIGRLLNIIFSFFEFIYMKWNIMIKGSFKTMRKHLSKLSNFQNNIHNMNN